MDLHRFIDKICHKALELGRVSNLVLRLAEDGPELAGFLASVSSVRALMVFERNAIEFNQAGPIVFLRDNGRLIVRRLCALMRHLQEQQKSELLDLVAIGQAVVVENIAVIPEFVD